MLHITGMWASLYVYLRGLLDPCSSIKCIAFGSFGPEKIASWFITSTRAFIVSLLIYFDLLYRYIYMPLYVSYQLTIYTYETDPADLMRIRRKNDKHHLTCSLSYRSALFSYSMSFYRLWFIIVMKNAIESYLSILRYYLHL